MSSGSCPEGNRAGDRAGRVVSKVITSDHSALTNDNVCQALIGYSALHSGKFQSMKCVHHEVEEMGWIQCSFISLLLSCAGICECPRLHLRFPWWMTLGASLITTRKPGQVAGGWDPLGDLEQRLLLALVPTSWPPPCSLG